MINRIEIQTGEVVESIENINRKVFLKVNGNILSKNEITCGAKIYCNSCKMSHDVRNNFLNPGWMYYKKPFICRSCLYKGNGNPFFGKNHTAENIKLIKQRTPIRFGTDNPFFGKTHTDEIKNKLSTISKENHTNRDIEKKRLISQKLSESQKRLMLEDPEKYKMLKTKAGRVSHESQKRYLNMNKIEKIVSIELNKRNIPMQYSVILDRKQYDFGNKEHRILLEVNGDYWHANPSLFGEGGERRKLNDTQIYKIGKDKEKYEWCISHNMTLFTIWENDIESGDFSVLDKIKDHITNCAD